LTSIKHNFIFKKNLLIRPKKKSLQEHRRDRFQKRPKSGVPCLDTLSSIFIKPAESRSFLSKRDLKHGKKRKIRVYDSSGIARPRPA
jgi:hypothetical protein